MGQVAAVLLAAGKGSRMGAQPLSKQFLPVNGCPILAHTLARFTACSEIDLIVLVIREEDHSRCQQIVADTGSNKVIAMVGGGKERQDSVWNGLQPLPLQTEIVLIHDAVRMFVTNEILTLSIQYARNCGASATAVPVKDTIKKGSTRPEGIFVEASLDRQTLWQVQTPQTFTYAHIYEVHRKARMQGFYGTDDAMLMEHFGYPVQIVPGSYRNIKITTPDDLLIAEAFLRDEEPGPCYELE